MEITEIRMLSQDVQKIIILIITIEQHNGIARDFKGEITMS